MRSRYRGAMLGLATGDALGTTLEFKPPGSFKPIDDMVGDGPFRLKPGQWTDDTSMALCLAKSLIEKGGFDAEDQMQRYVRWYRTGYMSSTGECFDIGNTIRCALQRFENGSGPFAGSTDPASGGNGSLMRLAPVALAFASDPEQAIHNAGESSRTTHGAPEPIDACRYYAGLIVGACQGCSKDELLSSYFSPVGAHWQRDELSLNISHIAAGSSKKKQPPEIIGGGYVVHALEAALWAFWNTDSFKEGVLRAVNLGDDADTTGAIYGQLAGAFYGVEEIPKSWRKKLAMCERIIEMADQLLNLSSQLQQ